MSQQYRKLWGLEKVRDMRKSDFKRFSHKAVRLSVGKSVSRTTFEACDNSSHTKRSYAIFIELKFSRPHNIARAQRIPTGPRTLLTAPTYNTYSVLTQSSQFPHNIYRAPFTLSGLLTSPGLYTKMDDTPHEIYRTPNNADKSKTRIRFHRSPQRMPRSFSLPS